MNGGSVCKKLLIWQVVTSSETYLSPFFMTTLHLILWDYGWSLEFTSVMTFNMLSISKILSMTLLSTKLTISSMVATGLSKIGQPCLSLRWIRLQQLETG